MGDLDVAGCLYGLWVFGAGRAPGKGVGADSIPFPGALVLSALPAVSATQNAPGKARPKFAHATTTKTTITRKPQVILFAHGFC
jgi:hypothetical protein